MFSRNKRQQQSAPIQPPIRPVPKEPVTDGHPISKAEPRPTLSSTDALKPLSTSGERQRSTLDQFSFAPASTVRRDGSVLASDLTIEGNVTSTGGLSLDGRIVGDVNVESFQLGSGGVVDGTIRAQRVEISGTVNGSIVANDVALMASARVNGDIEHAALSIESGAELNGAVRRSDNPLGEEIVNQDAKTDTKSGDDAPMAAIELGSAAMLDSDAGGDAELTSDAPLTAQDGDISSVKKPAKGKGKALVAKD